MRLSIRALSGLRVTGLVLLLGGIGALGVAYTLFVARQARYLESRNFRLLQSLAAQTEGAIRNEVRVFESQAREFREDTWTYLKGRRYPGADLPATLREIENPTSHYGLVPRDETYVVGLTLSAAAQNRSSTPPPPQQLWLPLASILEPVFRPKVRQTAFDTVVLASEEGEVWFAVGSRAGELRSSRLDALVVQTGKTSPRRFAELLHTSVIDLVIGGVDYKLFAQPCCRFAGNTKAMMVAGLVEADALTANSRAIPTTLVKLAALAVLAALVSWPFLRLMLLGGRQRVRALDVLQLGVSSVAAVGLLTMTLLDAYAYRRMNQQRDHDLAALARAIEQSFTAEMTAASKQLSCLEHVTRELNPDPGGKLLKKHAVVDLLAKDIWYTDDGRCEGTSQREARGLSGAGGARPPSAHWPHPFFESFSLITAAGMQDVKLSTMRWMPSRIPVDERRYFKDVRNRTLWQDSRFCPQGKGCTLESVLSWTTGEAQAVLSTVASNKQYLAAALSLPLRSLAQPVLPPGFEFAVIDGSGAVFFHSDPQRNGFENFFKETDDNRRLRAQVLAHSTEPLDLRYWGAPYRAYVRPLAPFELSVVTLFQKEKTWALNREWLVVSLLFLGAYTVLCGMALMIALALNPSWMWPDPARARRYPLVIALNALLLVLALVVAARWQDTFLVWCAYLIPVAAWAGTFALLRARPLSSEGGVLEPLRAHRLALVLLLIVSGAVPGLLLFLASFQLHIQSYVKHGHFRLVQALVQREERMSVQYARDRGAQRPTLLARVGSSPPIDRYHDLYYDFFHGTCLREANTPLSGTMKCVPTSAAAGDGTGAVDEHGGEDQILGFLESYLPYYSESSIEWRELLHDRAGDDSWRSRTDRNGVLTTTLPASAGDAVTLASIVPRLFGADDTSSSGIAVESSATGHGGSVAAPGSMVSLGMSGPYVLVCVFGLLLVAVARQLVVFVTKHVFLTGIAEPLWSSMKLTANAGDNLFVLCDAEMKARQIVGTQPLKLGPIAREANIESALRRELIRLGRTDPSGAVLVDDFDEDVEDATLMDLKVTLLERLAADRSRVVVVLSQLSPMAVADTVRRSRKTRRGDGPADRWQRLMDVFVLTDWRGVIDRMGALSPEVVQPAATDTPSAHRQDQPPGSASGRPDIGQRRVRELLMTEGLGHPLVRQVCDRISQSGAVRRGELTYAQVLEEISEQAAPCYRRLWSSCSDDERVVLVHLAQDGLTHAGARPVVRKLLARKLLHKAPELRLMNRTFQLFVLSSSCCAEVSRLEASTGPSVWDNLRVPLGVAVLGAAVFLIATQRELYEALLGATTAAAVSVPTIVRAVGMLSGRRAAGDEKLA